MKKSIIVLIILVLCLTSLFALTACNNEKDGDLPNNDCDLQYGVKYSYPTLESSTYIDYYVFKNDGTGEYRYKYIMGDIITDDYTLHFKYTFADNDKSAVVCYFDSIEKNEDIEFALSSPPKSSWNKVLLVSKNAVLDQGSDGYKVYTNENYYKEIPNYRK